MLAEMMLRSDEEGRGVIQLTVPSANTIKVAEAIRGVLSLAGHKVRRINSEGEEVVSADEVFPDGCPAMALRGLRGKEDLRRNWLPVLALAKTQFPKWKAASVRFPQKWPSVSEKNLIFRTRFSCRKEQTASRYAARSLLLFSCISCSNCGTRSCACLSEGLA